jgi:uncharacterized protein (UPF0332 family)
MTNELIDYRRNRAKETLNDAEQLFNSGSLFSAVNRIYYAVFYEVTALLLTKGLSSPKHSGIKSLFNKEFVKIGKVSIESGRLFARMFDFRQKSDYEDFVTFEKNEVREWLEGAKLFVKELEEFIEREEIRKV